MLMAYEILLIILDFLNDKLILSTCKNFKLWVKISILSNSLQTIIMHLEYGQIILKLYPSINEDSFM